MFDEDDMMLNIAVTKKPKSTVQTEEKTTKTDLKRIKYSQKIRTNSKNTKSKPKASIQEKDRAIITKSNLQQQIQTFEQTNKKKSANYQNERKNRIPNRKETDDVKPSSLQKKRFLKPRVSQLIRTEFDPKKQIKVQVEELMPEKQQEKKKILDTNELSAFQLHPKLQQSLIRSNITKLTDIQLQCYAPLFESKADAVIKASTGSGKTLAYLIPTINRILNESSITKRQDGMTVLVICPTRELCVQGQKETMRCLKRMPYVVTGCLFGGEETNHEKSRLRKGTNILFCTPGRVLYHLQHTQSFKLTNLKQIIFEEADRTLDMGFQETVEKILQIISQKTSLQYLQKILVSAHFNTKVSSLLQTLEMSNPKFIGFDKKSSNEIKIEEDQIQEEEMTLEKLKKTKDNEINTSQNLKQQYLLLSEDEKIPFTFAYIGLLKQSKVLIFVSTIDEVQFLDYLFTNLKYKDSNGVPTDIRFQNRPIYKIHGDLDQKLRSKTYLEFRQSKDAILISTEVASRGLDFPDLSHIILFDVPPSITDYGNRVGRSGRFNQTGVSLLLLHYQESDYAEKIRYFCPDLQLLDKDVVFEGYEKVLKSMNIGDRSMHYIEGLVRSSVKDDDQKYQLARKAYVSMLRAYARLPDRNIFAVKKLNLKLVARTFGLNNAKAGKEYNPKAKESHLEASRKKRKVEDVKKLQVSEYL